MTTSRSARTTGADAMPTPVRTPDVTPTVQREVGAAVLGAAEHPTAGRVSRKDSTHRLERQAPRDELGADPDSLDLDGMNRMQQSVANEILPANEARLSGHLRRCVELWIDLRDISAHFATPRCMP